MKRFARIVPLFWLLNVPMLFANVWLYHDSWSSEAQAGALSLTFVSTFTFARYGPWNPVTWTIIVFVWLYVCYPCIAPALRKIAPSSMRACAAACYAMYIVLALLLFAGLPTLAGWSGGSKGSAVVLDFGSAYNVAFVNVPVFVMGCCAGFDAVYRIAPPPRLARLYSLGGSVTIASGTASGCLVIFAIGIYAVNTLKPAAPSGPFADPGDGEDTVAQFVTML